MDWESIQARIMVFAGTWAGMTLAAFWAFRQAGNAGNKRKVLAAAIVLYAGVFIAMTQYLGLPRDALWGIVPFVGLVGWLNYRTTRFCSRCSAHNVSPSPWYPVAYCRACGAPLENSL